jgi:hypothetical protein
MRAIRDIPKGEELCYSYVNLYQSTETRREQLHKAYSFHCICQRCSTSSDIDAVNCTDSAPTQTNPEAKATSIKATNILATIASDTSLNGTLFTLSKNNSAIGNDLKSECEINMTLISDEALSALEPIKVTGEVGDLNPVSYNVVDGIDDFLSSLTSVLSNDILSIQKVLFKLKQFLNGKKIGRLHPAHKSLFQCYHLYYLTAIQFLLHADFGKKRIDGFLLFDPSNDDDDDEDIFELEGLDTRYSYVNELEDIPSMIQGAVGYGILALGCLKKYVGNIQTEIGMSFLNTCN